MTARIAGDGHEAQVDLARPWHARVERIADLADALFQPHAAKLQRLDAVGLARHHFDLDLLFDAAVTFEARILLVGDEVRRLLVILDGHVDGLRKLELVGLDDLHGRIAQHELVAAAVDAEARGHFEGQVATAARLDLQPAARHRDDPWRVQHAVVQAPLLQVVRLGCVPVLVGGEEAFEEVDTLEVGLLRHCILQNLVAPSETTVRAVLSIQTNDLNLLVQGKLLQLFILRGRHVFQPANARVHADAAGLADV
jgi:hypothetical protein